MFPVMCYDYHGKWDKKTGHNAPLKSRPDEKGNDLFFNLEYTVEYLVKKGAKPEKTVLGVPLYGRAFLLKNSHDDRMGAPAQANSFAGIQTMLPIVSLDIFNQMTHYRPVHKGGWLFGIQRDLRGARQGGA